MNFLRILSGCAAAAMLAVPRPGCAGGTANPPDYQEVYGLIRDHLAGVTESNLDNAAVEGLLSQLHGKVTLVSGPGQNDAATEKSLLLKSAIFDGPIACLRVGRVGEGLVAEIAASLKKLGATNQLKGVVLDLRFADGHDYAAAAAAADLFVSNDAPLLDWGSGNARSKAKSDAITLPVAILVNHETAGAAEALAVVLRDTDRAMIIGETTAGEATAGRDFPLKNGQVLRIATTSIKAGADDLLTTSGIAPDIRVAVKPEDERAYLADPFKELPARTNLLAAFGAVPAADANGGRPAHTTEADLIRERKERPGVDLEYDNALPTTPQSDKPVVHDPVLGRALDLLTAISIMRNTHAP